MFRKRISAHFDPCKCLLWSFRSADLHQDKHQVYTTHSNNQETECVQRFELTWSDSTCRLEEALLKTWSHQWKVNCSPSLWPTWWRGATCESTSSDRTGDRCGTEAVSAAHQLSSRHSPRLCRIWLWPLWLLICHSQLGLGLYLRREWKEWLCTWTVNSGAEFTQKRSAWFTVFPAMTKELLLCELQASTFVLCDLCHLFDRQGAEYEACLLTERVK